MDFSKSAVRGSLALFYLLIGLEIIIMITPFAAYYYGAYGPLLNFLYRYSATAWLTGFFLPHAVVSKSGLLNVINGLGQSLFSLGIIAFLIGAVQVYYAKFRGRGLVTGFLYRWIRHPQYLFLAMAGLGLLLFWPRFFILILYITMLFVYYLLAKHEEGEMIARHGDEYRSYLGRTAMFIPGEPGGKLFRLLFGWLPSPGKALAVGYGAALTSAILIAFGLRSYTISKTATLNVPERQTRVISVLPGYEGSLAGILKAAYEDSTIDATLKAFQREGHKGFLVHVMPRHYMMEGLFVEPAGLRGRESTGRFLRRVVRFVFPFLGRSHHGRMMAANAATGEVRLVFSQLTWPNGEYATFEKALAFRVKRLPFLRADVDPAGRVVRNVERTSMRNYWGQMPMPPF
ncbi:MAG: methyltransferase family protein [Fidelibacterota bacterium]